MANARALDKRRKSIKNIRKITRTMELIATARFKQAMDRASAATAYTDRITGLVANLSNTGMELSHPLLKSHDQQSSAVQLVLTSNRGLCGGYNGNVLRRSGENRQELASQFPEVQFEVSGKRGVTYFEHRQIPIEETFLQFEDKPKYEDVEQIADRYLEAYATGKIDRLDVCYTKFLSIARQQATVETLLPLGTLVEADNAKAGKVDSKSVNSDNTIEFLPSAETILEEVVPMSFKVKLFKCFLDAAVSEQVARMVAMKSATENADELIRELSMTYNRARQGQITGELLEVMGGVEALKN
ncbi:MAG: ATP synthase F1 subunit gamma [Pirellulales bacterium]|nr:ATP synthase F1 subunit gamma [Pirellulales bacterium]